MKYLTYSSLNGFNIIESEYSKLEDARFFTDSYDVEVLDYLSEIDPVIVKRIEEMLKDY